MKNLTGKHGRRTAKRLLLLAGLVLFGLFGCLIGRRDGYLCEGRLTGKPVGHPVTVVRDVTGVPHIYGEEPGDLFFGLGYIMAQDRLFQMDLLRHAAQGRLAEWLGNLRLGKGVRLVQIDMLLKCFEIEGNAVRAVERMPSEDRRLLERFAEGINQLLADREDKPHLEYRLLRVQPGPWTAADAACIPEIFGAGLALVGVGSEILYEAMKEAMGAELAEDFFQRYARGDLSARVPGMEFSPAEKGASVADPFHSRARWAEAASHVRGCTGAQDSDASRFPAAALIGGLGFQGFPAGTLPVGTGPRFDLCSEFRHDRFPAAALFDGRGSQGFPAGALPRSFLPGRKVERPNVGLPWGSLLAAGSLLRPELPQGSNNWVVSGSRTENGKPILANDPHVPLGMAPNFWYHAHLEGGGFSAAGLFYAGYPAVITGWNGQTAWGVTNVMADQVDLILERLSPGQDQVLTPDGWKTLDSRQVQCKVRFGRDRAFVLRKGEHGFLLPAEAVENAYSRRHKWLQQPASLRYVETDPAAFFAGQLRLMRAQNSNDVKEALEKIGYGPTAFNYVWATAAGDIGYQAAGRIPIRPAGQGYRPRAGWTNEADWQGTIPFDQLPARENPGDGFIQTANQRIAPLDYPWYITADYARPYRSLRIRQLLSEAQPASVEQSRRIQGDVFNLAAVRVIEVLREAVQKSGAERDFDDREREAFGLLAGWDLQTAPESAGAALFEIFYQLLLEGTFADEAGGELAEILFATNFLTGKVMDTLLDDPDNPWYDRRDTPVRETRNDVFLASFRETVRRCGKLMGSRPSEWSWGAIHTLRLGHPLGLLPWWGKPYRIARVPYPGDNDTVNGGYFSLDRYRGKVFAGAASRFIVDLARPQEAWFNCSTGMGGDPTSAYFKNLSEGWIRNEIFRTERAGNPDSLPEGKRFVLAP